MKGGKPTYDECDFVLSWRIIEGHTADTDLSNLFVVLSGTYSARDPEELWRVMVYVHERGTDAQREMLQEIFLGRAGGTPFKNFASAISDIISVHSARIELDHQKNKEYIRIGNIVSVRTDHPVSGEAGVSCGIPGHNQPGQEIVAEHFRVKDGPFDWDFVGRCGFATRSSYQSE
jgi:hypothetical protein